MLHVCSLAHLPGTVQATGASHVITVMADVDKVQRPPSILRGQSPGDLDGRHHRGGGGFHRTRGRPRRAGAEFRPQLGSRGADGDPLLRRHQPLDRERVRRSPARSIPTAAKLQIAQRIRSASAFAHPNRLIVSHADRLLGRDGRMLRALDEMGPGNLTVEGRPFRIDLD